MHPAITRSYTALGMILLLIACIYLPTLAVSILIALTTLILLITEWPGLITGRLWLLTPIYPVLPFILAIQLNQDPTYRHLLLILIACVCAHDTGAYIFGNLIGKHKLCPAISPKKTWQGLGGGFVSVILMLLLIGFYMARHIQWPAIVALAAVLSIIATLGDLFESWLKRNAGVKDSGSLLPGHGGLLDRFDGMMSCMYLVYPLRHLLLYYFNGN